MTTEDFKEFVEEKGWEQESNRKGGGTPGEYRVPSLPHPLTPKGAAHAFIN